MFDFAKINPRQFNISMHYRTTSRALHTSFMMSSFFLAIHSDPVGIDLTK